MALQKKLSIGYDDALAKIPEALKTEGFGVLTEIDVKTTLKQKMNVDFRRYKVLGACAPQLAHAVVSKDPAAGVFMPCNVVVYEGDDGKAVVAAIDPLETLGAAVPSLRSVADDARARLQRTLEKL